MQSIAAPAVYSWVWPNSCVWYDFESREGLHVSLEHFNELLLVCNRCRSPVSLGGVQSSSFGRWDDVKSEHIAKLVLVYHQGITVMIVIHSHMCEALYLSPLHLCL